MKNGDFNSYVSLPEGALLIFGIWVKPQNHWEWIRRDGEIGYISTASFSPASKRSLYIQPVTCNPTQIVRNMDLKRHETAIWNCVRDELFSKSVRWLEALERWTGQYADGFLQSCTKFHAHEALTAMSRERYERSLDHSAYSVYWACHSMRGVCLRLLKGPQSPKIDWIAPFSTIFMGFLVSSSGSSMSSKPRVFWGWDCHHPRWIRWG